MCVVVLCYRRRAGGTDLVLGANRDEFLDRPTESARFWPEAPGVLAGRDRLRNGTWIGVTRNGRLALVTNFRDASGRRTSPHSRGTLVADYLRCRCPPAEYLGRVDRRHTEWSGFNLILGDGDGLYYYSNRQRRVRRLETGVYGLSNHLLDTNWPKVAASKRALARLTPDRVDAGSIFEILADRRRAPDRYLPDTGVGREWERILSARFVVSPDYGTRSSTVLLVGPEGRIDFYERSFRRDFRIAETRHFSFFKSGSS